MRVFISWRGANRDLKNEIVDRLRKEIEPDGDEVWESDGNVLSDFSEDCMKAISGSSVFVILVTDECVENPSLVLNELIEAHDQYINGNLNMVMFKTTNQPLTDKLKMHLNHVSDAYHQFRPTNNLESGINALVSKVKELLKARRDGNPVKPFDVEKIQIEGSSFLTEGYVVESSRDDTVEEIERAFLSSNIVFVSGIDGFGRKCAVGEYIKKHGNEYKEIVYIEGFSGSLSELIAYGISISNLNEGAFEKMDFEGLIEKKLSYLKKSDATTILIAPNVQVTEKDERIISRIRKELKLRFLVIAEEISSVLFKRYPDLSAISILVSRMSDDNLKTLFYYYYSDIDDDEKTELENLVEKFFSTIDGHTYTVKVAAETLDREGADLDEAITLLEDSIKHNDGKLEDRIVSSLTAVFRLNRFDDTHIRLLHFASLICVIPVQYKVFRDLMDSLGVWDSEVFKHLVDIHWICYAGKENGKYVSMKPYIIKCCQRNTAIEPQYRFKLFNAVFEKMWTRLILGAPSFLNYLKIGKNICAVSEWDALGRMLENFYLYYVENTVDEELQEILDSLFQDAVSIPDSCSDSQLLIGFRENVSIINDQIKTMIDVLKKETTEVSIEDSVIDKILLDYQSKYKKIIKTNPYLSGSILALERILKSEDVIKQEQIEEIFSSLLAYISDNPEDEVAYTMEILIPVLLSLVLGKCDNIYKRLVLSRAYIMALEENNCEYSVHSINVLTIYFNSICQLTENTEEVTGTYETLKALVDAAQKEDFFPDAASYSEKLNEIILIYSDYLLKIKDVDSLEALFYEHLKQYGYSASNANFWVKMIESLFDLFVSENKIADGFDFLRKNMEEFIEPLSKTHSLDEDLLLEIEGLQEALKIESGEVSETDDFDGSQSYYSKTENYRHLKKYEQIADKVPVIFQENDPSSLTREVILREITELKKAASQGAPWQTIAPRAFALVSESGYRVLGYRHHRNQLLGGCVIFDGNIAEIRNGEGKTYTIILAAFLHYIYGRQVTILDNSEYLTRRNYSWMRGVLEYLGLSVGLSTKNEKALSANDDVIYESVFSALFGEMNNELSVTEKPNKHDVVIIDEADIVMFSKYYFSFRALGKNYDIKETLGFVFEELKKRMTTNPELFFHIDSGSINYTEFFYDTVNDLRDTLSKFIPEIELKTIEYFCNAFIQVFYIYSKGREYFVKNGKPCFETNDGNSDTFDDVYDFFISKKENLTEHITNKRYSNAKLLNEMKPIEFIKRFKYISGTTATASNLKNIFNENYNCDVVPIPTHKPVLRIVNKPFIYYWKEEKHQELISFISEKNKTGQPILVVTESMEESSGIHQLLSSSGLHAVLLNSENEEEQETILGTAGELGKITVSNALANRGIDIQLGGNAELYVKQQFLESGIDSHALSSAIYGSKNNEIDRVLREQYYERVRIRKAEVSPIKRQIEELGGLCVIGTSCFDDIRTEVQLEGRCARQGSPGECFYFYSFEDNGIKQFLGSKKNALLTFGSNLASGNIDSHALQSIISFGRNRVLKKRIKDTETKSLTSIKEKLKARVLEIKTNMMNNPACIWREMVPYIDERIFRFIRKEKGSLPKDSLMRKRDIVASTLETMFGTISEPVPVKEINNVITVLVNKTEEYIVPPKATYKKIESLFDEMLVKELRDSFWNIFRSILCKNGVERAKTRRYSDCESEDQITRFLQDLTQVIMMVTEGNHGLWSSNVGDFRTIIREELGIDLSEDEIAQSNSNIREIQSILYTNAKDILDCKTTITGSEVMAHFIYSTFERKVDDYHLYLDILEDETIDSTSTFYEKLYSHFCKNITKEIKTVMMVTIRRESSQ